MDVILIDYSESSHYREAGVPLSSNLSGKFVQIRHRTTEYLVLAPREVASFHADIVERFCREKGLHGSRNSEGNRYDIFEPAWVIVGGGKFDLDREKKHIRFYDNSMAYGKFNRKGFKGKIVSIGALSDYSADIE